MRAKNNTHKIYTSALPEIDAIEVRKEEKLREIKIKGEGGGGVGERITQTCRSFVCEDQMKNIFS